MCPSLVLLSALPNHPFAAQRKLVKAEIDLYRFDRTNCQPDSEKVPESSPDCRRLFMGCVCVWVPTVTFRATAGRTRSQRNRGRDD